MALALRTAMHDLVYPLDLTSWISLLLTTVFATFTHLNSYSYVVCWAAYSIPGPGRLPRLPPRDRKHHMRPAPHHCTWVQDERPLSQLTIVNC